MDEVVVAFEALVGVSENGGQGAAAAVGVVGLAVEADDLVGGGVGHGDDGWGVVDRAAKIVCW